MTGPLEFFTMARSSDMPAPRVGLPPALLAVPLAAASLVACFARASCVQTVPVIAAAAPITALRMIKVRRSMLEDGVESAGNAGNNSSFLSEDGVFMVVYFWVLSQIVFE